MSTTSAPTPAPTPAPAPLRERLRSGLTTALKARDRATASVLRATLAAIENAEAVAAPEPTGSLAIEALPVGVGAEAERRVLTEADVAAVVRAERAEREDAAAEYERLGHGEQAARLRTEAGLLSSYLG
ncbi:hypothetical protein ACIA8O_02530 [Kitasatospora sp. NPDC051853]|uniref:hypothetical protein n=1 Tax=Kitasatospora sp. NPDC051853 TaxID=3364058 RepID=UPI00378D4B59